jgi:hypothetical protein
VMMLRCHDGGKRRPGMNSARREENVAVSWAKPPDSGPVLQQCRGIRRTARWTRLPRARQSLSASQPPLRLRRRVTCRAPLGTAGKYELPQRAAVLPGLRQTNRVRPTQQPRCPAWRAALMSRVMQRPRQSRLGSCPWLDLGPCPQTPETPTQDQGCNTHHISANQGVA